MAIAPITVGDVDSISKINQAIDKANLVDEKASQSDLDAEVSVRAAADAEETSAREAADSNLQEQIDSEVDTRAADDLKRPLYAQAQPPIRPGEAIRFFTGSLDGEPAVLQPLPDAASVSSTYGRAAQIDGAGIVAPMAAWRLEPGHLYRLRFVVRRVVDTEDPSNDAVRLGVRWLDAAKAGAGSTALANILDLTVEAGRVEYVFTLAAAAAPDVDAVPPASGIYFRPFVQAFGSGLTHVEVIQVVDATDAVVWSPDVEILRREIAALTAQIQTLSDRVETLEN